MTTTFKQVTFEAGEYVKPKNLKPGTVIHGIFIETSINPKNQAVSHKIKLMNSDREILLSGVAFLNALMAKVQPGAEVKIKYLGMQECPGGQWKGTQSHQFEVSVAETVSSNHELSAEEIPF